MQHESQPDASRLAGMPLGTIIVRAGLAEPDQVEQAIKESVATGRRLGQVLLTRRVLSAEQLNHVLELQGRPRVEHVDPAPLKQLVRVISKDGRPLVTLRCFPKGSGCSVDYELHGDRLEGVETKVYANRDAAFKFIEETTETFRLLGCETDDTIGDEPPAAA